MTQYQTTKIGRIFRKRTQSTNKCFRKEEKSMDYNQPCIAIDVSKGSSHVCGFRRATQPHGKIFRISHDSQGFESLKLLSQNLNEVTNQTPIFIFETTGIYHRAMKRYFDMNQLPYKEVSPLLAAKHRKNSAIRSGKTDARDTHALSKLFYDTDIKLNQSGDEVYHELKQLHRYYLSLTSLLVKCKVHFNEKLDVIFPNFRKEIAVDVYKRYYLELLKQYPHPEVLSSKRVDAIENVLIRYGARTSTARRKAERIKTYAKNCWSGSDVDSVDTFILVSYIEQIQEYQSQREHIIERMIQSGKQLHLYGQLQTIPGIASKTAICLIAELGDLSMFVNSKQIIAYAGLDPVVYQSGQNSGKGLSISKKGNKHLRTLCFTTVQRSVGSRFEHPNKSFYQKKRQNTSNYSAIIASCDKMLRIIFSMNQTGEIYKI